MNNNQKLMTFEDDKGREWSMKVDASTYLRLREDDIDLSKLFEPENKFLEELLLGENMFAFLGIIGMVTESQREKEGISKEDFYDSLGGSAIEGATLAFIQAIINFSSAPKRPAMQAVVDQMRKGIEKSATKVMEMLTDEKMERKIDQMIEKQITEM